MACLHFINAINTSSQALLDNGIVAFNQIVAKSNCIGFVAGGNTFKVPCCGTYKISFDGDIIPTATGNVTVQLVNNGNNISGASATIDGTQAETSHIHVQGAFTVLNSCQCINNTAAIQVQMVEAGALSNANIIIERME